MSLLKKTISTLVILNSLAGFAATEQSEIARVKVLDKMMTTIDPGAVLDGPIFKNTDAAKLAYGSEFVKTIIQEAHKRAKFLLDEGNEKAYYAFLTLALTVPLHEGLYLHFRETNDSKGLCNQHASSGDILYAYTKEKLDAKYTPSVLAAKKLKSTTYKNFTKYFKNGDSPFFPDCDKVADDQVIRQIIRGGDGSDIGAMQLSIRWHYETFLAKEQYKSFRKTVRYGVNFLMQGYKPVLYNWNSRSKKKMWFRGSVKKKRWSSWMKCLKHPTTKKLDYAKLIRGTWAGKYNSGSIAETCRFADTRGSYANHDKGFKKNLDRIHDFQDQEKIGIFKQVSFKLNDEVKSAYNQILSNYEKNKNVRTEIEKVLK
ncbi:hypothetical protein A9Q84_10420 [Halobacteriovorax marinus]|uniref:Lipoprotein n=1 Tax=Halobacteriovorax marinus TaxID=97084 RepID=A0A1Y5F760_9BACT|nr:hypothetical protein A9Q84_10420 [Halobacteriovorax marinus]